MIYYTLLPEAFSSVDYEKLYFKLSPCLPDFRRRKADCIIPAKERALSALSFFLLCHALSAEYGSHFASRRICDIGRSIGFSYGANGKPKLLPPYEYIHFNISHCRLAMACAVAPFEIGIDIQDIRKPSSAVLRHLGISKAMCDDEASHSDEALLPDDCRLSEPEGFSALWSRYEAYIKLTGEGLKRTLPQCELMSDMFLGREHVAVNTSSVMDSSKKTAAFLSAAFFSNNPSNNFKNNSDNIFSNISFENTPISVDFTALCESTLL